MMARYANTAIVLGSPKGALLYFDHIIPVNFLLEPRIIMLPRVIDVLDKDWGDIKLRPDGPLECLPPSLRESPQFFEKYITVNQATARLTLKALAEHFGAPPSIVGLSDGDYASIEEVAASAFCNFMDDFRLKGLPLDYAATLLCSEEDDDQSETVISLASLQLVDADRCSWEQILEFRRDDEARDKLRRLRLFAYDNYAGKSKEYVEDDILKRIADYDEAVKQWGFETTSSAINMLLTSKIMGGALTGSLVSTLFGAPTLAVAAAVGGSVLEIGRIALEVSKQRFSLRKLAAENPVSYISHVRSKLGNPNDA